MTYPRIVSRTKMKQPTGGICQVCHKQYADMRLDIQVSIFRGDDISKNVHSSCVYRNNSDEIMKKIAACKTCGGTGEVYWDYDNPETEATEKAHAPCPKCNPEKAT